MNGFRESLSMQMKETVNRGFEVYLLRERESAVSAGR